jgi:hypothetical protein
MKKVLVLALSALAAALLIPTAFAGSASKVTGDVTFTNMGLPQHWVFSAQDLGGGAAKGSVLDAYNGGTTISKVISVQVDAANQNADFATEVTSSTNNPWANVGDRFVYTVHDGGEGANGSGDYMIYHGVYRAGSTTLDTGGAGQYNVTSGNIQIH